MIQKAHDRETATIEVKAIFPSAGEPFVKSYEESAPLRVVKADILTFFGLREETVGNEIISFLLYRDNDKLDNLDATVGSVTTTPNAKLVLRVLKDILFG